MRLDTADKVTLHGRKPPRLPHLAEASAGLDGGCISVVLALISVRGAHYGDQREPQVPRLADQAIEPGLVHDRAMQGRVAVGLVGDRQ